MAADNAAMAPDSTASLRGLRAAGQAVAPEDDEIPAAPSTDWSDLPWKKDGQAWHLEQRHRSASQPRRWDAEALRWLIQRVEEVGGKKFEDADWANVAHVEARAAKAKESADWFLHVLTGGSDLFDAYFRVPGGTFNEARIIQQLAIPTLDERHDAPISGNWQRVQVRTDARNIQSIRIQVFDRKDVQTKGFEAFLQQAVQAHLQGLTGKQSQQEAFVEAAMDRRAWHLAGKAIGSGQKPRWSPAMLVSLCGLFIKHIPGVKIDWSHKTGATIRGAAGRRYGRVITNKAELIEVWLFAPAGSFEARDVERIGAGGRIYSETDDEVQVRFKLVSEAHLHSSASEFIRRWAEVVK